MSISNKKKIKMRKELKYKVRWYDRIIGPIIFLLNFIILPFVIIMILFNNNELKDMSIKERFKQLLKVELDLLKGKVRGWKNE